MDNEAPLPGIWDFEIGLVIGEGSFGKVVYGQHKATGKAVALKVTDRFSCQKHPFLVESLKLEQALLRQLGDSEFIVKLLSSFVDSECVYLVLECCTGGTLQDSIAWQWDMSASSSSSNEDNLAVCRQEWSIRLAYYGQQILNGLLALHATGYIHADLKPSNVLLSTRGKIRLTDFGSAMPIMDTSSSCSDHQEANVSWRMTSTDYASPQLLKGWVGPLRNDEQDESDALVAVVAQMIAIDVWAFGCLLFASWQGETPFHAASDALAIDRITEYVAQSTKELRREWLLSRASNRHGMDGDWLECILDFLHPEPQFRFKEDKEESTIPSMSRIEMVQTLHERLRNHQIWSDNHVSTQNIDFSPRRSPDWWIQQQEKSSRLRDGAGYGWVAVMD